MINTLNSLTEWQKIAKIWQIQLNLEYTKPEKNVRLSFKDIGAFTELTAINYLNGYTGSGSGGMGFDLINYEKHKAIEVKSCCTIQNSVCNNCGTKFNSLFLDKCPKCNLNNFKEMSDSRFGISAIEFLDQFEKGFFECFYLCYISLIEYNKETSKIDIQLEWFKIDFSNDKLKDIQLEYFITQKENVSYCDRVIKDNLTCKDIGNKEYQKRKQEKEPVYNKYRSILSKKCMRAKRNSDLDSYINDYEYFKEKAQKYLNDIKEHMNTALNNIVHSIVEESLDEE